MERQVVGHHIKRPNRSHCVIVSSFFLNGLFIRVVSPFWRLWTRGPPHFRSSFCLPRSFLSPPAPPRTKTASRYWVCVSLTL